MDELKSDVVTLINKAARAENPLASVQLSQAALNAAHAMTQLQNIENARK
jgi:hypothetical protein